MRHWPDIPHCGDDVTYYANPARFARRSRLKAAVLGMGGELPPNNRLDYALTGRILDINPHVLVLGTEHGERRFPLPPSVRAWRGGPVPPAALRPGDHLVARCGSPGGETVTRLWAQAGRVTGTVVEREGPATLLVDEGPTGGRRALTIDAEAAGRIQVRFPRLEPGYLIDVIGLRHDGFL